MLQLCVLLTCNEQYGDIFIYIRDSVSQTDATPRGTSVVAINKLLEWDVQGGAGSVIPFKQSWATKRGQRAFRLLSRDVVSCCCAFRFSVTHLIPAGAPFPMGIQNRSRLSKELYLIPRYGTHTFIYCRENSQGQPHHGVAQIYNSALPRTANNYCKIHSSENQTVYY